MDYNGDHQVDSKIYFRFSTYSKQGASITYTGGTLKVYRNSDLVELTVATGITIVKDFDGITGHHALEIDTAFDATNKAFFTPQNDYFVVMSGATIDTETVSFEIGAFSIENRDNEDVIIGSVTNTPADGTKFIDTALAATTNLYNNMVCVFTTGALKGINREISAYDGTTKEITLLQAFPLTPANGDRYKLLGMGNTGA